MTQTSAFDNEVRLTLYKLFVDNGRAPLAAEIAEALGVSAVDVETGLRNLHDAHVVVLAPGTNYIWMANPFCALPTAYRATVGGKTHSTNCAFDAFGAIAMLGGTGRVEARCGDCAEPLTVEVPDEVAASEYVVHYAVPAAKWWDDIGFT